LDESKKAAKPTLDLSQVVFIARMRAIQCSPYPRVIPHRMRAKELTRLELVLSQVFSYLDESKKAAKSTLDLSQVVFIVRMRARQFSPYPGVIPHRMRAKELTRLELALSQVFSDLDESKKAAKPTFDLS
jgi:hypothetical protein